MNIALETEDHALLRQAIFAASEAQVKLKLRRRDFHAAVNRLWRLREAPIGPSLSEELADQIATVTLTRHEFLRQVRNVKGTASRLLSAQSHAKLTAGGQVSRVGWVASGQLSRQGRNVMPQNQTKGFPFSAGVVADCAYCTRDNVPVMSGMDSDHQFYHICDRCI